MVNSPIIPIVVAPTKQRECGTCSLCCKVMGVESISKPINVWCKHIQPDKKGCSIYPIRPGDCKSFTCFWLDHPEHLPDALRPDRVHAVILPMAGNANGLAIYCDPGYPIAYKDGKLAQFIEWAERLPPGQRPDIMVVTGKRSFHRHYGTWHEGKQVESTTSEGKRVVQSTLDTFNPGEVLKNLPPYTTPAK